MRVKSEYIIENTEYNLDLLYDKFQNKEVVMGTVTKYIPENYLVVDLGNNIEGKLLIKDFEDAEIVSKSAFVTKVGSQIKCYIDSIYKDEIYLNRAKLQHEYKEKELSKLEVGTIFDTYIVSISSFGLFVDMGYGVVGLLPIGDISITRVENLRQSFSVGSPIKVVYKGQNSVGYIVSHRELLGNWEENLNDFQIGEVCQGIVREITSYGAFIEIAPNLTGLADFPEHFNVVKGDSISVLLKSYNTEKLKIKLHIIAVSPMPYKVRYNYKIQEGVLNEWIYTPKTCSKEVKTVFKKLK